MRSNPPVEFEETFLREQFDDPPRHMELPASRRTFIFVIVVTLITVLSVTIRIGVLGIVQGSAYEARALANVNKEVRLPANRGVITDRYGKVLADNIASFSVVADLKKLYEHPDAIDGVFVALGSTLSMAPEDLKAMIGENTVEETSIVPLVQNIAQSEVIAVRALNIPGIEVVDDYTRRYPDGNAFAHVIGYTGVSDTTHAIVGKVGIEASYDAALRGTDGKAIGYRDAKGTVFETRVVREPEAGKELQLTIDGAFQKYAYDRLTQALQSLGRVSGAILAIQPKTGEVLAMVSAPSFDNNAFVDRSRSKERTALLSDPRKPLFNRAISGRYNPGSTIKPLVALGALHENVMNPTETVFSSGVLEIANPYNPDQPGRFLDWKANGFVDIRAALARSSNIYFYVAGGGVPTGQIAPAHKGLGIAGLRHYWQAFLLGEKTGIDIPGEDAGFLPAPQEKEQRSGTPWRLGDTYNVSIGQGDLLLNAVQLLDVIASVANNGKMMRPFLVENKRVPEVRFDYSDWTRELAVVQGGMEDAVEMPYGTAHSLQDLPFNVAAKTGTAQIENNKKLNAFFVGYAPADDPQIALVVLVEDIRIGSLSALPVAEDLFAWYYEHRIK